MPGFRSDQESAISCTHSSTRVQLEPSTSPHYAKLVCAQCGVQLRILPSPESIEQRKRNAARIEQLRTITGPGTWERDFVDSLVEAGKTKLSPAQQKAFDKLYCELMETWHAQSLEHFRKEKGAQ
jgi:hypothetical protein